MNVSELLKTDYKIYVDVIEIHDKNGSITPLAIKWDDGRNYAVDKVLDIRKAASLKAGGAGLRYTIRIGAAIRFLFLEEERGLRRWFLEAANA